MLKILKLRSGEELVTDLYHTDNLLDLLKDTEEYDILMGNEILDYCDMLMIEPGKVVISPDKIRIEKLSYYSIDFIVPIRSSDVIFITNPDKYITDLYYCFLEKLKDNDNLSSAKSKILQKTLDQLTISEIETLLDTVDTKLKN